MPQSKPRRTVRLVAALAKAGFAFVAVVTPLLGVWIGSSLAKALGGPLWVPVAAGALAFPVVPLLWEAVARWRGRSRPRAPILTLFDRLVLRTLTVNVVFVGGLLALYPSTVFTALSQHGDWMLEGRDLPTARSFLHGTADRMQWIHELTHPNPYESMIDPDSRGTDEDVTPWEDDEPDVIENAAAPEDVFKPDAWPFEPELHPLVRQIPADEEATPESIGRYFAAHEPDPKQRLKAVHDYAADRIAYDVESLRAGRYPPQDAKTVLSTGLAVCAGYAELVVAIGRAADLEVVVVSGKTRERNSPGHAWNAAKIDDKWYLLDATWDAGSVGQAFEKSYRTSYFMTPPDVFLHDHFPDDPKWQLRGEALSYGDFLRRPELEPSFFAYGFGMVSPTRASVATDNATIQIELTNRFEFDVHAQSYVGDTWDGASIRCRTTNKTTISCPLQQRGPNFVVLFGPDMRNMAQLHVSAE